MRPNLIPNLFNARRYSSQSSIQEWISSTLVRPPTRHTDTVDALRASHLLRTLPTRQHSPPSLRDGDELVKGGNMIYFQPETMLSDLGRDGSSTEYNAPHPYSRRMWAGGSFAWPKSTDKDRILRIGNKVVEERGIAKIEHKVKGDMIFIHQQRTIWNKDLEGLEDKWGVKEIRTHVFRPPSISTSSSSGTATSSTNPRPYTSTIMSTKPNTDTNTNKKEADISFTYTPTSPLLFRYSALTFNAHKIHYDHPRTVSHEQQRTLLVHGPLTATLLIELAVQAGISIKKELVGFDYRAVGPIYVDEQVELGGWWDGDGLELEARQGGSVGMKASATFA